MKYKQVKEVQTLGLFRAKCLYCTQNMKVKEI